MADHSSSPLPDILTRSLLPSAPPPSSLLPPPPGLAAHQSVLRARLSALWDAAKARPGSGQCAAIERATGLTATQIGRFINGGNLTPPALDKLAASFDLRFDLVHTSDRRRR